MGQGAVPEPRGGGDGLWGWGDGPLFLLACSCGPGLEEPQVCAVRVMVKAPPSNRGAAGEGASAVLLRVAVEEPVRAKAGAELSLHVTGLWLQRGRR